MSATIYKNLGWVVGYVALALIAIIGLVLYSRELFGIPLLDLEWPERTNILFSFAITLFAFMEGYSTFMQVEMEKNRYKIEDARNELEKAYGPLYTLLNKSGIFDDPEKVCLLSSDEKNNLDEIIATYPFMFPPEIFDVWREKIQNLNPTYVSTENLSPSGYEIPFEFRDKINDEYDRRVKKYKRLLEK